MTWDVILVAFVGALVNLDRTAAFQFMVSRPLAVGPVTGLVLGQPAVGVIMGCLIELLYISRPPLGGHIPPNECLATILTTAGVILAGSASGEPDRVLFVLGFLLVSPLARGGVFLERKIRSINGRLARAADKAAGQGLDRRITALNLAGLGTTFAAAFLYLLILLPPVTLILNITQRHLPASILEAIGIMYLFLPLIGVAAALSAITVKHSSIFFALAYAGVIVFLGL